MDEAEAATALMASLPARGTLPLQKAAEDLTRHFKEPIFRTTSSMFFDGETKHITHEFPASFTARYKHLQILHLTDVQYGHICCAVDKFIEYRDWVLAQPNRFVTFGGDMVDAYRMGSPGDGYDNLFRPDSQFMQFCRIVAPMRHRILSSVGGNHERRGLAGGVDWGKMIAFALRIPYSSGIQHVRLKYGAWGKDGREPFRLYVWHGTGAARTEGAIVNNMIRVVGNDQAHIYFSGHLHRVLLASGVHNMDTPNGMKETKWYAVSGSSFLGYYGGYAEIGGFKRSKLMMPLGIVRANGEYRIEI